MTLVPKDASIWGRPLDHTGEHGALLDEVKAYDPKFIEELGPRVTYSDYNPRAFGNSLLILDGATLRIRLSRDRSQVFVDLASASDPETWWHMSEVYEAIHKKSSGTELTLEWCVSFLRSHFLEFADTLGDGFDRTR